MPNEAQYKALLIAARWVAKELNFQGCSWDSLNALNNALEAIEQDYTADEIASFFPRLTEGE